MISQQPGGGGQNIGSVVIDPDAESESAGTVGVSGKQEEAFFDRGRREHEIRQNELNLGWLGKFWGGSSAASNVAGLVAITTILMIFVTLCFESTPEITDTRKLLFGLVGSALSFLFGAATKK
ncbi:hypothetical protein [Pseudomonas sp. CFBP 8772]|uniref:hypothetical protein n=1 Tax=Pseudomonas sp. CFBP 8772 TaxID=2775284 RepID=UPI0017817C85|nr:hypothetical protein [Pseudomonas sp. CFBP 8772]MBD8598728.1 hypothetical protein [Pseudomonas sp. CFBP 8772]